MSPSTRGQPTGFRLISIVDRALGLSVRQSEDYCVHGVPLDGILPAGSDGSPNQKPTGEAW